VTPLRLGCATSGHIPLVEARSLDPAVPTPAPWRRLSLPQTRSARERTHDGGTRSAVTRLREPLPRGAGHIWDDRGTVWKHPDGLRRVAASCRWRRERRSGGATFVVMMYAAEVRDLHDGAAGRRLRRPRDGRILVQREVSSPFVIVDEVLSEVAA